jgi:protein O-GlcNAc transferase
VTALTKPPISTASLLAQGQALHADGQTAQALALFEQALAQDTNSLDAANACAALLVELGKTKQAFHLLDFRRAAVLQHPDSACNWAIVCEELGQTELARQAYEAALQWEPQHLRALNNSALMAAKAQDFETAIARLTLAHQLQPQELGITLNLCDAWIAASQSALALPLILAAFQQHTERADLEIRLATLLAFCNQLDAAQARFAQLSSPAAQLLVPYLESIGIQAQRFGWHSQRLPPVADLFFLHGFYSMQSCQWSGRQALTLTAAQQIMQAHTQQRAHDWRDLQFYALMLELTEESQGHAMQASRRHFVKRAAAEQLPAWREHPDGRVHMAIATQNLHEERAASQLHALCKRVDSSRFALHIFSNSPSPTSALSRRFQSVCSSYTEVAALSALDLARAIRAKQAHLFLDTAFYTPWCRAELPFIGVAPVQLRHQAWHRLNPGTVQFAIGDDFTHPQGDTHTHDYHGGQHGPTIRLPYTCWLAADDTVADYTVPSREELGLPEDALVLCSRLGTPMLDPSTFALWMKIMHALPNSVLWLASYDRLTQTNLRHEAQKAGILGTRIVFTRSASRSQQLAQLRHADLFLDALLFNANHGLVDALRMGVPAISCAGLSLASRLGGSIIRAAGLHGAVFDCEVLGVNGARQQYLDYAVTLGRDPSRLQSVKSQLQAALTSAPLFQTDQRIHDWQTAWQMMADQARNGLPFTAFDVPKLD